MKTEKSSTDAYLILLINYARSPFRDFEPYLWITGLDENDIHLLINQYNSNFVTYEIPHGVYNIKDTSEAVHTAGDNEGTLRIQNDEVSMKTKHTLSPFAMLRFIEKKF